MPGERSRKIKREEVRRANRGREGDRVEEERGDERHRDRDRDRNIETATERGDKRGLSEEYIITCYVKTMLLRCKGIQQLSNPKENQSITRMEINY